MTTVARHARGLIVAVVVLLFTAGIALGAKALPTASSHGLDTAAEAAGKTVPVRAGQSTDDEPATPAEDGDTDEDEATTEDEETPAVDETDGDEGDHDSIVAEAAQTETPGGFRNHGEWVSCVTHLMKLPIAAGAEPLTLEDIDKAACDAYEASRHAAKETAKEARDATKAERQAGRDAKKAARDARRADRTVKRGG